MNFYKRIIKPVFDFLIALIGIIIISPLLLIITILLIFQNDGSPFFKQSRPGRNGKIFRVIKFRTMNNKKDATGKLLPDTVRLTKIGRFIRQASLDEIPQLINVLKGEMSIVGPRPLLVEYLPFYNDFQKRRHEVLPGITGWAQVNGRNALTWEKKFEYDVWYVDNISFFLDLKILLITFIKVFKQEGIALDGTKMGEIILEPFKGSPK